jgi:heme oxygenase
MSLKELTHSNHVLAEAHPFTKVLLSGSISPKVYADLLTNQLQQYIALETQAKHLLLPGLARAQHIAEDLTELNHSSSICQATVDYVEYIQSINDPKLLWAHLYVKHMGDLFGGQILKKLVPGSGRMYEFENRTELIKQVRQQLSDDMADEANRCFTQTLELFTELANEHNIQ